MSSISLSASVSPPDSYDDNNLNPTHSGMSSRHSTSSSSKQGKQYFQNNCFGVLNTTIKSKHKFNSFLNPRKSSVVYIRDELDGSEYDDEDVSLLNANRMYNQDDFIGINKLVLKPPLINSRDLYNNNNSSKATSRRSSAQHAFITTPSPSIFPQTNNPQESNMSSPMAFDKEKTEFLLKKHYSSPRGSVGLKSNASFHPQFLNTDPSNGFANGPHQIIHSPMGPLIPLQVAIPSPFDQNYGSYLIPANLMTPYSAHPGHAEMFQNGKHNGSYWNMNKYDTTCNTTGYSNGNLAFQKKNAPSEYKVNYQYTFNLIENSVPFPAQNAIIFTNVNDNLKLHNFMLALKILYSDVVQNAIQFSIDKNGQREVNTFLIEFISYQHLEEFTNNFIRDLQKWKKILKSVDLIFKKCLLQTTIIDPNMSDISSKSIRNFSRFLIVDTDDVASIKNLLEASSHFKNDSLIDSKLYFKVLCIVEVNPTLIFKDHSLGERKKCHLLVFHNPYYKKLAVDLLKSKYCSFDLYDIRNIKFSLDKGDVIGLQEDTFGEDTDLLKSFEEEKAKVLISQLKNDGSFNTCPFSEKCYDVHNDLQSSKNMNLTGNFYKIASRLPEESEKSKPQHKEDQNKVEKPAKNCEALESNFSIDSLPPSSSAETVKARGSPINRASDSSISSDTLNGEFLFDSRNSSTFSKGVLLNNHVKSQNTSSAVYKSNSKNRLVYISNLPPVVKTFDIVNIVRGGIVEQIQYVPGQRYCFIKFIYPDSAKDFMENSEKKPIVLHGYTLSVQFGNKGNTLSPIPPALLKKVLSGATRNVYLSLPEFSYKQKYTSDPKYSSYGYFQLPKPQQIINDFSLTFGPLEQINFAGDGHCCWINFMSIHSAVKLLDFLQEAPQEFHNVFKGRYEGLVLRYGKDRCAKKFKNFI